jgi:hypothetical protein
LAEEKEGQVPSKKIKQRVKSKIKWKSSTSSKSRLIRH